MIRAKAAEGDSVLYFSLEYVRLLSKVHNLLTKADKERIFICVHEYENEKCVSLDAYCVNEKY